MEKLTVKIIKKTRTSISLIQAAGCFHVSFFSSKTERLLKPETNLSRRDMR